MNLESMIPDPGTALIAAPLFALYAIAAAWLAGWLRDARGVRTPYTRKIFHFTIFTTAALLQIFAGLGMLMLFSGVVCAVVIAATLIGDGFPFYEALARPTDAPHRTRFILIPMATTAAGGLLANVLFGSLFAPVGYMVCGWGDAVGEPVGTRWGKHRYRVPSLFGLAATRSLEGSAAVALAGSLAACAALLVAGFPPGVALGVAAACGVLGALVEAISHHGLDNLTIQLAGAGVARLLLG